MSWEHLVSLFQRDKHFMGILQAAQSIDLPNWAISGGSIRDLVWSNISGTPRKHKDIDLIYLDSHNLEKDKDIEIEADLRRNFPESWNVKNQARFSQRHNVTKFSGIHESMSFAPSTVSAIGVSQLPDGRITAFCVYGFRDLFEMRICATPRYMEVHTEEDFQMYVKGKGWLQKWPTANLITGSGTSLKEL